MTQTTTTVDDTAVAVGLPFAKVLGQSWSTLPEDLYIPPDALEVFLETFEGPLDLLLYLIKRQNLNILDIPILQITRQYIDYIEIMQELKLELAAEYLVMAAMLAEIKSRLLLPRSANEVESGLEEDPRAELIRRLQEYERFKQAAENLEALPREERDIFLATVNPPDLKQQQPLPQVQLNELIIALKDILKRVKLNTHHRIHQEPLSIRQRMADILDNLSATAFTSFTALFSVEEGRFGVVVTFIAILELMKQFLIEMVQVEPFAPIHVRAIAAE